MFGTLVTRENRLTLIKWLKKNYHYVRIDGGASVWEDEGLRYWTNVPFYSPKHDATVTKAVRYVKYGEPLVEFDRH